MPLPQRIYKTKKPRQRTRRPKTGPWSEFNPAILLNIWSAIILPSFSFDTMDPSLSWEVDFCRFLHGHGHRHGHGMDTDMDMDMDTDMDTDMETDMDTDMETDMDTDLDTDMDKDMKSTM
jgi:hypothetical protein